LLLLSGVAALGHLGAGHSDREAQGPEDLPAREDHPRRAHHRSEHELARERELCSIVAAVVHRPRSGQPVQAALKLTVRVFLLIGWVTSAGHVR
jgi:hypothetical protein